MAYAKKGVHHADSLAPIWFSYLGLHKCLRHAPKRTLARERLSQPYIYLSVNAMTMQVVVVSQSKGCGYGPFTVATFQRTGEVLAKIAIQNRDPEISQHDLWLVQDGKLAERAFYFLPDYVSIRKKATRTRKAYNQIWYFDKRLCRYVRQKP